MTTAATTPPVTGGVVAVHAHPDDETLTSGALLATWAAAGLPALVVTCTRGERGEVIGAELAHLEGDGPALAAHRERELARAVAALGADQVFLDTLPLPPASAPPVEVAAGAGFGPEPRTCCTLVVRDARYEDSGMAWVGTGRAGAAAALPDRAFVGVALDDEAAGRLAGLLLDRRPDLVVTYEPGGGYGHPDHVRAHEVTMRAVELARAADADGWRPAVAWAVQDPDALRAGYAALAEDPVVRAVLAAHAGADPATRSGPLVLPDPDGPLPSVAAAGRPDLVVDVVPVRDRLLGALRAHATQVQAVRPLDHPAAAACLALSNLVLAPVLPHEGYRWAPGGAPAAGLRVPPGVTRRS
ncbi:PIG-L family deacetylase [Cellulomonas sp. ES6]|uniref:PIG-L family deacetylase n=1 Tax=Cellulomonas sp. ES6 TaxID=3039384 RepID=UPI0024B6371A|nr:PIG-L family deacetylase [Cellulomonas sp. ES6]WHP18663.1 PIG-L family deacetylase [Cellulomonas sp. ES6]